MTTLSEKRKSIARQISGSSREPAIPDIDDITPEQFRRDCFNAWDWYRLNKNKKQMIKYAMEYISKHYSKDEVKCIQACPDWMFSTITCTFARLIIRRYPDLCDHPGMKQHYHDMGYSASIPRPMQESLNESIAKLIDDGREILQQKKSIVKKHPERNNHNDAMIMIQFIEEYIDGYLSGEYMLKPDGINIVEGFRDNNVKKSHAEIIHDHYTSQYNELNNDYKIFIGKEPKKDTNEHLEWEDIRSMYSMNKSEFTDMIEFYAAILNACSMIMGGNPSTPEAMVKSFKYCAGKTGIPGVKSMNPIDVIGSSILWVYDMANRNLGMYTAKDGNGLAFSGNSIINFDDSTSMQKMIVASSKNINKEVKSFLKLDDAAKCKHIDGMMGISTKLDGKGHSKLILLQNKT